MTLPVATEEQEQIIVVQYCRLHNVPCFHVPNSTWTKSIQVKMRNKRLGVSPGVPDLFVVVADRLIGIEMKRTKGGTVSPFQKDWIQTLNDAGIETRVCRGAEEAINFIKEIQGG